MTENEYQQKREQELLTTQQAKATMKMWTNAALLAGAFLLVACILTVIMLSVSGAF